MAKKPYKRTEGHLTSYQIGVENPCIFKPYRRENLWGNIKPLPATKKAFYLSTGGKNRGHELTSDFCVICLLYYPFISR